MTKLQRVAKIVDWCVFSDLASSRKDLAEKLGYTESSLSQILNGKTGLSERFIKKLVIFDKHINPDWIETGEGCMVRDALTTNVSKVYGGGQSNVNGDNINGGVVTIGENDVVNLIALLKQKEDSLQKSQLQIDSLIDIISKLTNNSCARADI